MITRVFSQLARGFAMGAADIVPGVSGGTVALLLGIYDRLVSEIRDGAGALAALARGNTKDFVARFKRIDWVFLLSLLAGIALAVLTLVSWLRTQIEEHPVQVSAVFFGLVAASVGITASEVKNWDLARTGLAISMAVAAFFVLGLRSGAIEDPSLLVVLLAGSVAICAMILPGISGSFILLMFGLYDHITEAVDERHLTTVAAFGVGAVLGLALFSTFLHWLLDNYRDSVMAGLIGLMAGSLRVLWPWPSGGPDGESGLENVELGSPVSGEVVGALIGAGIAALAVVVLSEVARRAEASSKPALGS